MRFVLAIAIGFCAVRDTVGVALRSSSKGNSQQTTEQRELMPQHNDNNLLDQLPCNENVASTTCEGWSTQGFDPSVGTIVIPCGQCVTVDLPEADTLVLPHGLNIKGKLVFPDGYRITIETSYVVVQGELEMTSTRGTSDEEDVKIRLIETTAEQQKDPLVIGNRAVAVAGGKLNIQGLPEGCPSWAKLKNIVTKLPASIDVNQIPSYIPPSSTSCTDNNLVETNFEGNEGISWPHGWYRNYGGTHSYESLEDGSVYALYGGRTSTWNGPQTNFDPACVVPGAMYFIYARARLTKSGGVSNCQTQGSNCLKVTLFTKDSDTGNRWRNKGHGGRHNDGEWFDFTSTITFEDKVADTATAINRRLYWEGPEAGVEIALDDIRVFRLPESSFPPAEISPSDYCYELIPNGDAEDTSLLPFTYPAGAKNGHLSVASEITSDGSINHYYSLRNRDVTWASLEYRLPVGCIEMGSVYTFGLDIRLHSATNEQFRLEMAVFFDNHATIYKHLGNCPEQDLSDGWVSCRADYQFPEYPSTPTKIEVYLVQNDTPDIYYNDGNLLADVDYDNVSFSFQSGPIEGLVLPDPDGTLESCWGAGSRLLVTSSTLNSNDVSTPSIDGITRNGDSVTITLDHPIDTMHSFTDSEEHFASEVALLSRNIVFSSDSEDYAEGGHLIVYHTDRPQLLDGVAFQKFGQQGNLGRYPVHFHMSGNATGSVVSRNLVTDSFQRCFVAHGTHAIVWNANVCYDHFGHGFLLEDHSERQNVVSNNLVAGTKRTLQKIRDDETDDTPASYWITNPENTFVENVAAGSESSGFWFEMSESVRGPSASLPAHGGYNPREQPLTEFRGNVAHSNDGHGIMTYPGAGYRPRGDAAVFRDSISFRNGGDGVFLHNSGNIRIEGGVFADNRIQIDIDRAPSCSVDGATILGYTDGFRTVKEATQTRGHCPSGWPLRGIELHGFSVGGSEHTGSKIRNTFFDKFDEIITGCDHSVPILIDEENKGYFDVRTEVSNLTFGSEATTAATTVLSNCATEYSGADNFVLRDADGSLGMGQPGYVVADVPELTTLADCTVHADSCTAFCPDACFRTVVLAISTLEAEDPSVRLEITDHNQLDSDNTAATTIVVRSSYELPLHDDGSIDVAEHTKSHRNNLFYAVLPSGGNYSARFLKSNGDGGGAGDDPYNNNNNYYYYWPLFVRSDYDDDVGSECPEFASFDIVEPAVTDTTTTTTTTITTTTTTSSTCQELIANGDMEAGIEGWVATMGGVASTTTIDNSNNNNNEQSASGLALTSMYRTATWMGPAQFLDTRCLVEVGATYRVSFRARLVLASDGRTPVDCDPSADACPRLIAKTESGAHQERDAHWKLLARLPTTEDSSSDSDSDITTTTTTTTTWVADDWNLIEGSLIVDDNMARAGSSTLVYFECQTLYAPDANGAMSQVLMVLDDVSFQKMENGDGGVR